MTAAAWARVAELWTHPAMERHYGEHVSQAEHMLQAAACAVAENASDELVIAALLHDVGHLTDPDVHADDRNRDHARVGAARLADVFGPSVTEPIRLHIAAKRYLVATDAAYQAELSPASVHTLRLQGGPLTAHEQDEFLGESHHEAALRLRRWDEAAKVAGAEVAPLEHYRPMIATLPAP